MQDIEIRQAHAAIFNALHRAETMPGSALPLGMIGTIHSAIDKLRSCNAPAEHLEWAEKVALTTHQLEWSIRKRDAQAESHWRKKFNQLFDDWEEVNGYLVLRPRANSEQAIQVVISTTRVPSRTGKPLIAHMATALRKTIRKVRLSDKGPARIKRSALRFIANIQSARGLPDSAEAARIVQRLNAKLF